MVLTKPLSAWTNLTQHKKVSNMKYQNSDSAPKENSKQYFESKSIQIGFQKIQTADYKISFLPMGKFSNMKQQAQSNKENFSLLQDELGT